MKRHDWNCEPQRVIAHVYKPGSGVGAYFKVCAKSEAEATALALQKTAEKAPQIFSAKGQLHIDFIKSLSGPSASPH